MRRSWPYDDEPPIFLVRAGIARRVDPVNYDDAPFFEKLSGSLHWTEA